MKDIKPKMKMKNKLLLMMIGFIFVMFACEEEDKIQFVAGEATVPVVSELAIDRLTLDPSNTGNPIATINWTASEYGIPAAVTYRIEVDSSSAFSTVATAATVTGQTSITWTVGQLNDIASAAGLAPFEWSSIYLRVVAFIGGQGVETVSESIDFEVFPFFSYPFEDFYLVGNATPPNWNNNNNNPLLFRNPNNPNEFYYTGFFRDGTSGGGQFKVLVDRGFWEPQYGLGDAANTLRRRNPGDDDPPVLPIDTEGYKTVTFNFTTLSYSVADYTETITTPLTSLSIGGSAVVGGTADLSSIAATSSNYDFDDPHIWYVSSVELQPGELTFTANGTDEWGATNEWNGVATQGGGSIPVSVGDTYEIWFNDLTGDYILRPINLSSN